jgi:hypothetical protein
MAGRVETGHSVAILSDRNSLQPTFTVNEWTAVMGRECEFESVPVN